MGAFAVPGRAARPSLLERDDSSGVPDGGADAGGRRPAHAELRDYLEIGYVSLADYVDDEFANLMREFRRSGEELAAASPLAREKVATDAWRRIAEQGRLARHIAQAISAEAEHLRAEFQAWQVP